jgi:hypothetical protein
VPDFEAYLNEVYYEPSDCVAIFEDSGVVMTEPVFLREGMAFVRIGETYYEPHELDHFLRLERRASSRPRLQPPSLPVYPREPRTAESVTPRSSREHLEIAQARWASERVKT